MPRERGEKVIATNRRARHDFNIEKSYEAGLVLTGTEVKSLRQGRANLSDGYAFIKREIMRPHTFALVQRRPDADGCDRAASYGMGTIPYSDCVLGAHFGHSGGLPGYGSNVLMLPTRGVGVFAFSNLTYGPVSRTVREAAVSLVKSGAFPERAGPPAPLLDDAARAVQRIYAAGDVLAVREALAMNLLLDRDAARRNAEIAALKAKLGACRAAEPIRADSAMTAVLSFPCERGVLEAGVLLAPTARMSMQRLEFRAAP